MITMVMNFNGGNVDDLVSKINLVEFIIAVINFLV